jgi:hypothetical protein
MFLAFGLALGLASGVAFIEVIRARPPARREIRLTVSQDAIPRRRATTLADDAFATSGPEPARGGPADRRELIGRTQPGKPERRTNVLADGRLAPVLPTAGVGVSGRTVGMAISGGADPVLDALHSGAPFGTPSGETAGAPERSAALSAVALLDPPADAARDLPPIGSGPCADERRLAGERCELATRAKAKAVAAADAHRNAQRACDAHSAAASAAAEAADPRRIRSLKEEAQRAFRAETRAAGSPDAIETAARTWLLTINRINREAAAASLTADRERQAETAIGATLERLSLNADAARVGANIAEAACVAAQMAVAECDEQATTGSAGARVNQAPSRDRVPSGGGGHDMLGVAVEGGTTPRIFRLLRGDERALETMVASLGGDDPDEGRRWRVALAELRDAILAEAIEHAYLRFPIEHPFWGLNTPEQNRDITEALTSLGYRFDGLGGWLDDRRPAQRDLSLALGYAGLDPMRVRHWPNEQGTAELFRNVEVAADEYLAGTAGDLTLAEMIELLGRRADGLVELWNHWGRIRPLLLEAA